MARRISLLAPPKDTGYIAHIKEDWRGNPSPQEVAEAQREKAKVREKVLKLKSRYDEYNEPIEREFEYESGSDPGADLPLEGEDTVPAPGTQAEPEPVPEEPPQKKPRTFRAKLHVLHPGMEIAGDFVEHSYDQAAQKYQVKVMRTVLSDEYVQKDEPFFVHEIVDLTASDSQASTG
jgi:hypothetical protein